MKVPDPLAKPPVADPLRPLGDIEMRYNTLKKNYETLANSYAKAVTDLEKTRQEKGDYKRQYDKLKESFRQLAHDYDELNNTTF